jgi:hypothetical protein
MGCFDESTIVNTAPSALSLKIKINQAAFRLNSLLGKEVYKVFSVTSEKRIDNQIVVSKVSTLGPNIEGLCSRWHKGIKIYLIDTSEEIHIAHELVHAMGLGHVASEDNLMYKAPTKFFLTEKQIDTILENPIIYLE